MSGSAKTIQAELKRHSNKTDALFLQGYFRTWPGQYGEGDRFRGIRVPVLRQMARKHSDATLETILDLLESEFHEDRLLALLMMVRLYDRGDETLRKKVYDSYLASIARINNWDLVDLSAPGIVGRHLKARSRRPIHRLSASKSLWERRIAVLSTFYFIKDKEFDDTLAVATRLLGDNEDLIHKAVGWMLREIGLRNGKVARAFLREHQRVMPRIMLRYAIEKFPEAERKSYLKGVA